MALRYTGERAVPKLMSPQDRVLHEHMARYEWVIARIREVVEAGTPSPKRIIDAPCGAGYGTRMLADAFPEAIVVGIDIDPAALQYAREHYGRNNIRFVQHDLDGGAYAAVDVDLAVCFEGIEHVANQPHVANVLCSSLRSGGRIIVSTPRRGGPGGGSPYHTHEMTLTEFAELFSPYVQTARIIGQDLKVGDVPSNQNPRYYILEGVR